MVSMRSVYVKHAFNGGGGGGVVLAYSYILIQLITRFNVFAWKT